LQPGLTLVYPVMGFQLFFYPAKNLFLRLHRYIDILGDNMGFLEEQPVLLPDAYQGF